MKKPSWIWYAGLTALLLAESPLGLAQTITLPSLLAEMTDSTAIARFPEPPYQCLQASSYNRASTNRNQPNQDASGWFADSDGLGFIRTETIQGRKEWVIMEHQGPGCITKIWTPFFYYGFHDRVGPNVRIYLDGSDTAVFDESFIKLVMAQGSVQPPFATCTARAGDLYLPIPFAKSCKVTMVVKPFYNIINYRVYPEGTKVETFTRAGYQTATADLAQAGKFLTAQPDANQGMIRKSALLKPGDSMAIPLPAGPSAIRQFTIRLPSAVTNPTSLRSTVLAMTFDGEETVWCPLGDFFCSADSLHPIHTWQRTVSGDGTLVSRWAMPYRSAATMRLLNLGDPPVEIALQADIVNWDWAESSMDFHANWRPDDVVPGTPFQDWNFIDIRGQGVFVGDAWTVLNIQGSWWGEGDEKIYVDDAWDKGFPTHFGTGTEDYYGWAGGEVPTRKDEFSVPFLANARVGGLDGRTTGFNICTRTRSLDAIPFTQRLRFDMESSFGTDIRNPWNLLGYSAVTFWTALPGASHNRPARPGVAARPIMSLVSVKAKADAIRTPGKGASTKEAGGLEFEQPGAAKARRQVRVFVVAGQSNAEGHNDIRQYHGGREPFPEMLRVQPGILFWPGSDTPQAKDNLWTVLRVEDTGAFGPEISFASDLERAMPGATIAIVKYAAGGTGIARSVDYSDYIPGLIGYHGNGRNWHPPTDGRQAGSLYSDLIANVRGALSALTRDGKQWELTGLVWMQGEHEAGISRKMAEDYERLLSDFIKSVRKDLRAPSLPVAIGQVNSHTWAYGDIARTCQAEVCRKDQQARLVQTGDLPRVSGDAAHFSADGMLMLGSRCAEAMTNLLAAKDGGLLTKPVSSLGKLDSVLETGTRLGFAKPGDGARIYARTARANFAQESFQAEVTVTLKGGGGAGSAFFGMGCGQGNASQYQEPSTAPSLFVRLAPSDFSDGVLTAILNGHETDHGSAPVGDGTHRIRLTWDSASNRALFELDTQWDGQSFHTDSLVTVSAAAVDFGNEARLFVGGANGVVFSDFSTKPLSDAALRAAAFGESVANHPTAGTWLPVGAPAVPTVPEVDELLKRMNGHVRLLGCWYVGSKLAASRPFASGELTTPSIRWNCAVRTRPVAADKDALDMTVTFKLSQGTAMNAGVAVAFDFADWSTNNYVLLPAAVYNGNRYRTVGRGYATGLDPGDYYRKDLPLTQTVVPRLEWESGKPSKLEVNSCNVTTPATCIFDRKARRGFIVLAEQAGRNGQGDWLRKSDGDIIDNAFAVEESADRSRATVVVSAPGVRENKPECIGFSSSPDRGIAWQAGDVVQLKLRAYCFETPDIPGLLEKFMTVRKAVTGPNHPRRLVPSSQVEKWMTERIDSRFHNSPTAKFYCPENAPWIAFGWVGGWMNTFPMLVLGDEKHLERVTQTFDYGLKAQESSGYFHYAIHANGSVTFRDPGPDMNLARTSGDMLFWMVKQFQLLKAQGRAQALKPEWEVAMKKLAEALVSTWRKDGQWGKLINVKTGGVAEYNTTGGATVIGALALASAYFGKPEYLQAAKEAAEFYYVRDFVTLGHTTGGCADILQNADSETAAGFMTSLMTLYEITGDQQWLEKSRHLANLVATWTVSFDYELPKTTEMGALGAKLAGVYWASTQNKHGAPGICTMSGDALFKIYRATGDRRYAELLRDIVAAHGESIRPGGFTNERLTYCDADSRGSRGNHVTGWNELNGILMAMELPGIYLRTDQDELFVFDHVEARVLERSAQGVLLELANPTAFTASVSMLAESAVEARKPLGGTAFLNWPRVPIAAQSTSRVLVKPDGTVNPPSRVKQ